MGRLVLLGSLLFASPRHALERATLGTLGPRARHGPSRTDLRRASLESDVTALLRRRPGQAVAWVQLGWLRFPSSREEASALARWGVALDPQHQELARVSALLRQTPR